MLGSLSTSPGLSSFSVNLEDNESPRSSSQRPYRVKKAKMKKKMTEEKAGREKKLT